MAEKGNKQTPLFTALRGVSILLITFGMIRFPEQTLQASLTGLNLWWENIFPALLPPLILTQLLNASGLLAGLAQGMAPLLSRIFQIPSAGGKAMLLGGLAGIPVGCKEIATLRRTNLITDQDIPRLFLLSHFPNPFFILLVVGVSFLQAPFVGYVLVFGLWFSAGLMAFLWKKKEGEAASPSPQLPFFPRTLENIIIERIADGRTLGAILADSVLYAIDRLMLLGGFMLIGAVFLRFLQLFFKGSSLFMLPAIYELHLGAYDITHSVFFAEHPEIACALLAAGLSWTGLAGFLQARATFHSDVSFPWLCMITLKLIHAAIASVTVYFATKFLLSPTAQHFFGSGSFIHAFQHSLLSKSFPRSGWAYFGKNLATCGAILSSFLLLCLITLWFRKRK